LARERLDAAAAAAQVAESAQRDLLAAVLELCPTSAWLAAGATSAKRWLLAYTRCSPEDAHRLERLAPDVPGPERRDDQRRRLHRHRPTPATNRRVPLQTHRPDHRL